MTGVAAGAVYDRGYRAYDGPRRGRAGARRALYLASVRRALGIRRPWRQKVFPWLLLAVTAVPAAVNVGVGYVTRDTPLEGFEFLTYREYVGVSTALLLFVALTAPDIICPDRRYRMLALVFSRPLTGLDYAAAKVGAIASITFVFGLLPQALLFVGQMLVSDESLTYLREHADVLWKAPASVAVLTFFLSIVGVAVASLTTRRVIAAAVFLGGLLVCGAVSAVLVGAEPAVAEPSAAELLDVLTLPLKLRDVIFLGRVSDDTALSGVPGAGWLALAAYLAVVAVAAGVLWARYRRVDA